MNASSIVCENIGKVNMHKELATYKKGTLSTFYKTFKTPCYDKSYSYFNLCFNLKHNFHRNNCS